MPIFKFSDPTVNQVNADISLHCLTIAGAMGATGSLPLPILRIAGRMQETINGEIRLWGLKAAGEVGVSAKIDSDMVLPILAISGDMQAEGSIVLHTLRIFGFVQSQGVVTGGLTIPALRVSGNVSVLGVVSGNIELSLMQVSGVLVQDTSARIDGAIAVPALRIAGIIVGMGGHNYGSETDATLHYAAARRHI